MSGRCVIKCAVLRGVEALPVDVEVSVGNGIPGFCVVGMADAAVQESRERVKAAIKAAGFSMPPDRVVVNLAPSSVKKTGSGFDLAIAVGILVSTDQIPPAVTRGSLFVGELSLNGEVRSIAGLLAYALCARSEGLRLVCSSEGRGLVPIEGLEVLGMGSLASMRTGCFEDVVPMSGPGAFEALDFADIAGNDMAKRALQIAAAGRHGVLMMGPPGSGKTMLASRIPSILPPLTEDEKLHVALIHSIAGEDVRPILAGIRPFRAPHHSATAAGLIGGGSPIRPGEISLAHNGVLFLDELAEVRPSVLQQLRQPLEDGRVCLTRADGNVTFPADFMLVAASNPCPCGYFGDPERQCTCTVAAIRSYQNRIGGPLMDRIDIHIDVRRLPPSEIVFAGHGTSSKELREDVLKAREYSAWRRARDEDLGLEADDVVSSCRLDEKDKEYFVDVARAHSMSGRGIVRALSIARTIADMCEKERVGADELYEALEFRLREGVGR